MSLISQWNEYYDKCKPEEIAEYMEAYYEREKEAYINILAAKETHIEGTAADLAAKCGFTEISDLGGFLDGINSSLETELDVESIEADTYVSMDINWRKLYKNMHKAKAEWLYGLEQWDEILTQDEKTALVKEFRAESQAVSRKIGPNEPCPCGSGYKYKNCCME